MRHEKIFINLVKVFQDLKSPSDLSPAETIDELKELFSEEINRIKNIETIESDKVKLQQYIDDSTIVAEIYIKFYENNLLYINQMMKEMESSLEELGKHNYDYYELFSSWDRKDIEYQLKNSLEKYNKLQESRKTRKKIKGGTLLIDYFNTNPTLDQLTSISILTSSGKKLTPLGSWGNARESEDEIENKSYHNLKFYYKEGKRVGNEYHGKIDNLTVVFD